MQKLFRSIPSVNRGPIHQSAKLPFDLKRSFDSTKFRCNFCSDKSVQTYPIWNVSLSTTERSRNCFESNVPDVNRSPIWYTSCGTPPDRFSMSLIFPEPGGTHFAMGSILHSQLNVFFRCAKGQQLLYKP